MIFTINTDRRVYEGSWKHSKYAFRAIIKFRYDIKSTQPLLF